MYLQTMRLQKEDKEIVINNDKKNKVDKLQDSEAIAKMNIERTKTNRRNY